MKAFPTAALLLLAFGTGGCGVVLVAGGGVGIASIVVGGVQEASKPGTQSPSPSDFPVGMSADGPASSCSFFGSRYFPDCDPKAGACYYSPRADVEDTGIPNGLLREYQLYQEQIRSELWSPYPVPDDPRQIGR